MLKLLRALYEAVLLLLLVLFHMKTQRVTHMSSYAKTQYDVGSAAD